ncbi:hypothetical protein ACYF6T_15665 [Streptomyces sp. 7R007]
MLRHVSERYARGFGAAVIAVTALVLAANAGPARAADTHHVDRTHQSPHTAHAPNTMSLRE